ncbi:hypothetical protein U9M48_017425 [Paspalum notatum var. saurae]|uniref:Uncharacterized protein n=1 Tax=Paspalum notatum var. saurae TaxID=547442 RepID=A0AAQ3T8I0_PASNO
MAAEAQAEGPALGPAPPPPHARGTSPASPEKRGLPILGDEDRAEGEEEERRLPEPKRRRACVAALDGVPGAAVAEDAPGSCCDADGACFSFQHARGGFLAPETTPKFGSFNPPGEAELKPAEAESHADAEADVEVPAASAREAGVDDDSSQLVVVGEVDGQKL